MHEKEVQAREILHRVERDRGWRRSHPEFFLAEIAEDLWETMTDEEAVADFRLRRPNVPWWAADVLDCLDGILRERPTWAARTLVAASRRGAWLGPSPDDAPDVYLDWLAQQVERMAA